MGNNLGWGKTYYVDDQDNLLKTVVTLTTRNEDSAFLLANPEGTIYTEVLSKNGEIISFCKIHIPAHIDVSEVNKEWINVAMHSDLISIDQIPDSIRMQILLGMG